MLFNPDAPIDTFGSTVEDSFHAKLSLLSEEGRISREEGDRIYRLWRVDPRQAMSEADDHFSIRQRENPLFAQTYPDDPHVPETVRRLIKRSVRMRIQGWWPLNKIGYEVDDDGSEQLYKYKTIIDGYIRDLEEIYRRGEKPDNEIAYRALGDVPEIVDIKLFAIATFVRSKKTPWNNVTPFVTALKAIIGETKKVSHFGVNHDSCVDVAALLKMLTHLYEIQGDIQSGFGRIGVHHIWKDSSGRRMIDIGYCPHLNGYIRDAKKYPDELQAGKEYVRSRH